MRQVARRVPDDAPYARSRNRHGMFGCGQPNPVTSPITTGRCMDARCPSQEAHDRAPGRGPSARPSRARPAGRCRSGAPPSRRAAERAARRWRRRRRLRVQRARRWPSADATSVARRPGGAADQRRGAPSCCRRRRSPSRRPRPGCRRSPPPARRARRGGGRGAREAARPKFVLPINGARLHQLLLLALGHVPLGHRPRGADAHAGVRGRRRRRAARRARPAGSAWPSTSCTRTAT